MIYLFMADGFEEVEGLTAVDILRRAGLELRTVSIMGRRNVTGSHQIEVMADMLIEDIRIEDIQMEKVQMLILPGGMPGTLNLKAHAGLNQLIDRGVQNGIYLAAICAAPTVYGEKGLLKGKKAVCYPGMEQGLVDAEVSYDNVAVDGKFITSRGLGTAIDFALKLVEILKSREAADTLAEQVVYNR